MGSNGRPPPRGAPRAMPVIPPTHYPLNKVRGAWNARLRRRLMCAAKHLRTLSDNRTFTTERRGPVAKRRPGPHVCVSNAHAVVYEQSRRVTRDQQDWIWDWVDRQRATAASNAERSTQAAARSVTPSGPIRPYLEHDLERWKICGFVSLTVAPCTYTELTGKNLGS